MLGVVRNYLRIVQVRADGLRLAGALYSETLAGIATVCRPGTELRYPAKDITYLAMLPNGYNSITRKSQYGWRVSSSSAIFISISSMPDGPNPCFGPARCTNSFGGKMASGKITFT